MFDDVLKREDLLVYLLDAKLDGGEGPIKVLPLNATDQSKLNNVLTVGQSKIFNEEFKDSTLKFHVHDIQISKLNIYLYVCDFHRIQ